MMVAMWLPWTSRSSAGRESAGTTTIPSCCTPMPISLSQPTPMLRGPHSYQPVDGFATSFTCAETESLPSCALADSEFRTSVLRLATTTRLYPRHLMSPGRIFTMCVGLALSVMVMACDSAETSGATATPDTPRYDAAQVRRAARSQGFSCGSWSYTQRGLWRCGTSFTFDEQTGLASGPVYRGPTITWRQ